MTKYIKNMLFLVLLFCTLFSINIYAENAKSGDIFVTSDQKGTPSGTVFTNATINVSNLDTSNNFRYYGVDVGVFKKPESGTNWSTIFVKRITTNSLSIKVTDFGDKTAYEYEGIYALGYRVLYQAIGSEADSIIEAGWQMVPQSHFVVKPIVVNLTAPTANQIFYNSMAVSGTVQCPSGDVLKIMYCWDSEAGTGTQLGSNITTNGADKTFNQNIDTSTVLGRDHVLYVWAEDSYGGKSNKVSVNLKKSLLPTLNQPTVTGSGVYGENAVLSGTGTNINIAKYRIFYTTRLIAPPIQPNSDYSSLGDEWVDSGKVGDMNVDSGTSILKNIIGPDLADRTWTYAVFKVGVSSVTDDWVFNHTEPYKLGDSRYNSLTEIYIDHVAHNQVIHTPDKDIAVSDPYTPVESYNASDIDALNSYNTFIDGDYLKYRIEFDVVKPETVKDIKIVLNFNAYNEDNVEVLLNSAKLYYLPISSTVPVKDLKSLCRSEGRKNRYIIALGDDNGGTPIIQANGKGRYVIEYTGILKVKSNQGETLVLIQNEANIWIYSNKGTYPGTFDIELPSNKNYIETRVWRDRVIYG